MSSDVVILLIASSMVSSSRRCVTNFGLPYGGSWLNSSSTDFPPFFGMFGVDSSNKWLGVGKCGASVLSVMVFFRVVDFGWLMASACWPMWWIVVGGLVLSLVEIEAVNFYRRGSAALNMSGRLCRRGSTTALVVSGRLIGRGSAAALVVSGRLFGRGSKAALVLSGQLFGRELTAALKVSGQLFKRESTAAWKVSGRLFKRESTAALKWWALWQRVVTAIGSLIERLDHALD